MTSRRQSGAEARKVKEETTGPSAAVTADHVESSDVLVSSSEDLKLRQAEETGNWDFIEESLQNGASVEHLIFVRDHRARREVLMKAVEKDLPSLAKYVLRMNRGWVHSYVDHERNSLLHAAAASNSPRVAKVLTEMNHGVDERNLQGATPLHQAATRGSAEEARQLLAKGADPSAEDGRGETPFKLAVRQGNVELVKLLAKGGVGDEDRRAAIKMAATHGHQGVVRFLETRDVEIGNETLRIAAEDRKLKMSEREVQAEKIATSSEKERALLKDKDLGVVEDLTKSGEGLNAGDEDRRAKLTAKGHPDCVVTVSEKGDAETGVSTTDGNDHLKLADDDSSLINTERPAKSVTNVRDDDGRTAIKMAAVKGVARFSEAGGGETGNDPPKMAAEEPKLKMPQLEVQTETTTTNCGKERALLKETFKDHLVIIKKLIQKGRKQTDRKGKVSFTWAALKGHLDVLRFLRGDRGESTSHEGPASTLLAAALEGHMRVVKLLVDVDGDPNLRDDDGETALTWAAGEGHREVVELLLENGAEVKEENGSGQTALTLATGNSDLAIVKLLLDDVNLRKEDAESVLMLAAGTGKLEVVKFLVADGCDVNSRSGDGDTPLMSAAREGRVEVVEYLTQKGADVNLVDGAGRNALMISAAEGRPEVVDLLLTLGRCDVFARDRDGDSAFALAACYGRLQVLRLLVVRGAATSAANVFGYGALMLAAMQGHLDAVRFLLEVGFDAADSRSKSGDSALTLAARSGHLNVVQFLCSSAGCDANARNGTGDTALSLATWAGHADVVNFLRSVTNR